MRKKSGPAPRALRQRLLRWFDRSQRSLPWRGTKDAYRVWLSEIMLQQTRVPVVVPYYQRFLQAYPTVKKLARAKSVLRLWAGLGYYQRARNLHRAAKEIVRKHGGRFPRLLEDALALPGIGPYTARAILSIAYGQPVAVVDGNVARVLVRLFCLTDADADNRPALQPLADRLVSRRRPGDFNQALMELGSTICLPKLPRCTLCPLEGLCAARQAGMAKKFPRRPKKRPRPRLALKVFVIEQKGKVLLVREASGYFSGLWHFPYTTGKNKKDIRANGNEIETGAGRRVATVEHTTTMRDLVLRVYQSPVRARDRRAVSESNYPTRWVRLSQVQRLGVGAATRKVAALLQERGRKQHREGATGRERPAS